MLDCLMRKIYLLTSTDALTQFKSNQKGVTAIEYGMIIISVSALLAIILYGENNFILAVEAKFDALARMVSRVVTQAD